MGHNGHESSEINRFLNLVFPHRDVRKVLLINPPDADKTLFEWESARRSRYSTYPPYGLLILAKTLIENGVDCKVLDLNMKVVEACFQTDRETFCHETICGRIR